ILGALALVLALAAARAGWLGAGTDGATLFGFAVAFFLAYRPLRDLTDARLALARTAAAMEEIRAVVGVGAGAESEPESGTGAGTWALADLSLRSLTICRGRLAPINLVVPGGAIVVLRGPTGVGKTTLLRTLLGLEREASGSVVYDGRMLDGGAGPRERP